MTKGNRIKIFLLSIRQAFLILFLLVFLSIIYVYKIEPNWFEIKTVNLEIPNLPKTFENFKIVQISDIHADDSMNKKKLIKIVQMIQYTNRGLGMVKPLIRFNCRPEITVFNLSV